MRNVVQEEDYNVGLKLQQGLETGLMESVLFGRNERGNQYFHRWVKWYSDGDHQRPTTRALIWNASHIKRALTGPFFVSVGEVHDGCRASSSSKLKHQLTFVAASEQ